MAAAVTPSDHGLRARGERDAGDSAGMRGPEPDTHYAAHRNPVGFELAGRVQTLDADALHLSRQRAFTEG